MVLVFGGSYQGKLEFVQECFGFSEEQCTTCQTEIDFSFPVINQLEEFLLHLVKQGEIPSEYIKKNIEQFQDKIVIMADVSCGVVPIDTDRRIWREEVGRSMVILSHASDEVYRVYCGIPTKLK